MTKIAKLADGRELQFPDETPDEDMHAKVREHVTGEASRAEDVFLDGQRNRLLSALVQSVQQLNVGVDRLCEDQYQTQALLNAVVKNMAALGQVIENSSGQLSATVEQSASQVVAAVDNSSAELSAAIKAPIVQDVERVDGKIVRTTITKGEV